MRPVADTTRKKITALVVVAVIVACFLYLTGSAERALRTAVFLRSPRSGITMEYQRAHDRNVGERTDLYMITANPTREAATDADLTTWIVYRFGPIHIARYYGEG